ncbi:type II secretion system protein [Variovorax sp. WS11]|uniref:type II secretion system F family protein n=1 Tax=Variovorax sp. WS11 TaxID=1105204 RepID=UPI000D0D274D|nr:type II secretion system F family protein [Variovorax sp. WS11]NDZ15963.1 type II secretion system F family protein [Variovorax sp. WS11]PSL81407.1 type II secretion system protein [Variovorax sp. WS11]
MMIMSALVFLAVTLGLAGLYLWWMPSEAERRLQALAPALDTSWTETVVKLVGPFAQLSSPTGEEEASPLRLKFLNAGIRHRDASLIFFGLKSLLPVLFAGVAFIVVRATRQAEGMNLVFWPMMAALIACYLPNAYLRLRSKARRREIFENFPDAADLMLVCVEAGLGLDAALTKVTEEIRIKSEALAQELHWTNLEMRAGSERDKSLRNLALRTGVEEIATFATMLSQADRFGTSIGDSLRVFSDDLRHKRQVRAEELAAKIPTKMLFPLVLFIFPSILAVIIGPAVIQVIRTMMPMMTGTN